MALTPSIVSSTNSRAINTTDVVVAVDVTGSMAVADAQYGSDEQLSRLDVAKQAVKDIAAMYPNSSFAALRFGASGTLDVPLTPDSKAIDNWADTLAPESTSISAGSTLDVPIDQLLLTCKSIHDQHPDDAIVLYLISDGEQTSSKTRRTFSSLRRYLSDAFTVAVGSAQGGNIPVTGDGVEEGDTQWVTDPETGEPGVSRMNADEMNAIADELSGTAIQLNATTTMSGGIQRDIQQMACHADIQATHKNRRHGLAVRHCRSAAADVRGRGMDHAIKEAAVSTTVTARASLPVRIAIAVIAAISVIVGVLGIVNLASVSNYNQATDSLNANIKASQQQDADFDKLQTQQQQTDAQFREAGAAGMLLLPNVRTSIEHNAEVSAKLTESIRKKIGEMQHADGTEPTQPSKVGNPSPMEAKATEEP